MEQKFKVGDKIKMSGNVCVALDDGETATVTAVSPYGGYAFFIGDVTGEPCSGHTAHIILINDNNNESENNTMATAQELRNLKLTDNERLLREATLKDSEGNWTTEGKNAILDKVGADQEDAIVADLKLIEKAKTAKK